MCKFFYTRQNYRKAVIFSWLHRFKLDFTAVPDYKQNKKNARQMDANRGLSLKMVYFSLNCAHCTKRNIRKEKNLQSHKYWEINDYLQHNICVWKVRNGSCLNDWPGFVNMTTKFRPEIPHARLGFVIEHMYTSTYINCNLTFNRPLIARCKYDLCKATTCY